VPGHFKGLLSILGINMTKRIINRFCSFINPKIVLNLEERPWSKSDG
jgi:hypothetical protein